MALSDPKEDETWECFVVMPSESLKKVQVPKSLEA